LRGYDIETVDRLLDRVAETLVAREDGSREDGSGESGGAEAGSPAD
jgi:hypothetical protein